MKNVLHFTVRIVKNKPLMNLAKRYSNAFILFMNHREFTRWYKTK